MSLHSLSTTAIAYTPVEVRTRSHLGGTGDVGDATRAKRALEEALDATILAYARWALVDAAHRLRGISYGGHPAGTIRPAVDRLLSRGDVQVAEAHLRDFGYDPGPVNGLYTAQTQAAVRAYQARYGLPASGLLDYPTRLELLPGLDSENLPR